MNERLSSILVPIYKLFPLIPVVAIVLTTGWSLANNSLDIPFDAFLIWIVLGLIFYFFSRNWRVVYLRDKTLIVRTIRKTVEIPVSQVTDVQASSWLGARPQRITIKLRSDTEIGNKIVFVPRGMGYFAGTEAKRIRRLLDLA